MRVAVEKIEGVESVEVSLNEGRVLVTLAPENSVTVARLREVVRRQGFSPREATLTMSARIEVRGDELVGELAGSGATFVLDGRPELLPSLRDLPGTVTLLAGTLGADQDELTPRVLRVTRVGRRR